ncbi:hypothetical protein GGR20_002419 [Devosia subaequoris]|uniref:Fimbrial protein n=1 Tax=Devosia subaequoris TaxID=395930 RepID=A0A7W6INB5_9HYPH|nr:DUF6476 family protein [Devosia subaequoris]MBB4052771.1 hypothetical protein [Devosia subaequoris]MCP1209924.1 DUF6476 family protein [Devosia subaequoris]
MSNPEPNTPDTADTELSPEARAMLGKARRSFAVSMGILLLGFMAIGFALVYRVMRDSPPPAVAENVTIPVGAEVISALSTDGTIQVTYSAGGATTLSVFDAETGELQRSVQIGTE